MLKTPSRKTWWKINIGSTNNMQFPGCMHKSCCLSKISNSGTKRMLSSLQSKFDYNNQKLEKTMSLCYPSLEGNNSWFLIQFKQYEAWITLFDKWQQARQENVSIASSKSFYCQSDNEQITFLSRWQPASHYHILKFLAFYIWHRASHTTFNLISKKNQYRSCLMHHIE